MYNVYYQKPVFRIPVNSSILEHAVLQEDIAPTSADLPSALPSNLISVSSSHRYGRRSIEFNQIS